MKLRSRLGLWTGVLLGSGFLFVGALFGQTHPDQVAAITSSLRARQFAKALELLQPALQKSPANAQLLTLQALAYSGQGKKKEALTSFRNALKASPDYLPALEGAAQIEYDAGNRTAVSLLEHVLRLRPDDQTSHAMLAVMAYQHGDCATALGHFASAGPVIDSQPGALQEYGACLVESKQTEKAIPIFQRILASHPEDARARRGLAAVQLEAGQSQDALTTLQPLLETSSAEVSTLQLAAAAYEANKDTPQAVKMLHEAIVKDPRNVSLYVDFANIALIHQSFQTGVDMLNAGLKLQPQAAELHAARGVLYVQLAEYEKAQDDFEQAEKLDPRQSFTAAAQGMLAEEKNQNDPEQALATVRAELTKKPKDAFLWYLQAAILAQMAPAPGSAQFQRALNCANKALALDPSLDAAHDVLAKLYLQSGQSRLAIKECRLALHYNPTNQTALYHLVLALRKSDDKKEIPGLLQRLAKVRQEATKEESEHNRYKLVVTPSVQSQ